MCLCVCVKDKFVSSRRGGVQILSPGPPAPQRPGDSGGKGELVLFDGLLYPGPQAGLVEGLDVLFFSTMWLRDFQEHSSLREVCAD